MQVRAQRPWYPSFCTPFLAYINDGDPLLATISFKARPATTSNPHVVASFLRRPRWTHAMPAVLNAAIFYLLLFSQSQHLKYKSSNPCCQMICQKCENTDFTLCDWLIKRWRGRYKNRRYKIKRYSMVWIPTDPKVHCESMNFVCVRNRYFAATLFSFHSRDGDADQPGGVVVVVVGGALTSTKPLMLNSHFPLWRISTQIGFANGKLSKSVAHGWLSLVGVQLRRSMLWAPCQPDRSHNIRYRLSSNPVTL